MFFFLGVIELTMVLFVSALLEGGLREASRVGATGFAPEGSDRLTNILNIIEDNTIGLVEMSDVELETLVYNSFDSVGAGEQRVDEDPCPETLDGGVCFIDSNGNGQFDEDFGEPGLGGSNDIVLYRLSYDWPSITGYLGTVFGGDDQKITLEAAVAVRNEPFGAAQQ